MKANEFYSLLGAITSLSESSDAKIMRRGCAVSLTGRCSPYVSHRHVEYFEAPEDRLTAIANSKHAIVFGEPPDIDVPGYVWTTTKVPVTLIGELWHITNSYFRATTASLPGRLCTISWLILRVDHWDGSNAVYEQPQASPVDVLFAAAQPQDGPIPPLPPPRPQWKEDPGEEYAAFMQEAQS